MRTKIFTILFAFVSSVGMLNAAIINGTCGDNLTWTLNTKDSTLTIEGNGAMYDFGDDGYGINNLPWAEYVSYIKHVNLPDGLTSIGFGAFTQCALTEINIPNSVVTINNGLPYTLTSLTIPENVDTVSTEYLKWSCKDILSFKVAANNQRYCSKDGVLFNKEMTKLIRYPAANNRTSYIIPNYVTSICEEAFLRSSNLKFISVPNGVSKIDEGTFGKCVNLTSIEIPNTVTSLEYYAFNGCVNLSFMIIGSGVTKIDRAFIEGDGSQGPVPLKKLICLAPTPPAGGLYSIQECGIDNKNCTLYVPAEYMETYQNAFWWEEFKQIKPLGPIHHITFIDWDGTIVAQQIIIEGDVVEPPTGMHRDGYEFVGWGVDLTNITDDTYAIAQYEKSQIGAIPVYYKNMYGETLFTSYILNQLPEAPIIDGFTFLGWQPVAEYISNQLTIQAVYQSISTNAPKVYTNPTNPSQKLIREGNIYILRDGKTYTIQGQEVK